MREVRPDPRHAVALPSERPARRGSRHRPPRRRGRAWLVYLALAIFCLLAGAATFLVILSPADTLEQQIIAQVKARTGRDLRIAGGTSLRLLPAPGLQLSRVALSGLAGEGSAPLLTADQLDVTISPMALLAGRVAAGRVRIVRPRLRLAVDAQGRKNWELGALLAPFARPVRLAQASEPGSPGRFSMPDLAPAAPAPARDRAAPVAFPDIEIVDGEVRYDDARTGRWGEGRAINATATRASDDAPVVLNGRATIGGEPTDVAARIAMVGAGQQVRPGHVVLDLTSRLGTAHYDGTVSDARGWVFGGDIALATDQLAHFARALGLPMAQGALPGRISLRGRLGLDADRMALDGLAFEVDGLSAVGTLSVERSDGRPHVRADLDVGLLDVERLTQTRREASGADPQAARDAGRQAPATIGEAIERSQSGAAEAPSRGRDRRTRDGRPWSNQPIPFGLLAFATIEAKVRIAALRWRHLPVEACRLTVALADGILKLDMADARIHGGSGRAVLTANADGHVGIDAALDDVDTLALLKGAGRFDILSGRGRVRLAVAGHGQSEAEIVETMAGSATLDVQPGAIVGWSVAEILERLKRLQVPDMERDRSGTRQTPFERLSARFKVADGVARTEDTQLVATSAGMAATGTVDLKAQALDLTLTPRIAGLERHASAKQIAALTVPLRLRGPWSRPRLDADVQKVLKSPEKALEAAREVGRKIKDEDVDKAVRGLLGDTPEAERSAEKAKKLLRRFLQR